LDPFTVGFLRTIGTKAGVFSELNLYLYFPLMAALPSFIETSAVRPGVRRQVFVDNRLRFSKKFCRF
jgi:hypothetical protein